MAEPRFLVERHTDDEVRAFRVRDLETGETHGFGLTALHAVELAVQHTEAAKRKAMD